jgi:hypothetical protein
MKQNGKALEFRKDLILAEPFASSGRKNNARGPHDLGREKESFLSPVPSGLMAQAAQDPSRLELKMISPLGAQQGFTSMAESVVSRRTCPLSTSTTNKSQLSFS